MSWDAENRLKQVTVNSVATTYLYDALSRRIAKVPASGSPTLYVYDGFNCIAEYTGSTPTLSKTRTWGLDLSGSLQGAGGVGGLLAEKQDGNYFYPTYDGNGNISEYLNIDSLIVAHYEYDPFGNTVVSQGSLAADFNYRFSTKPLDSETGLYYYLYRYYDPITGRWPSRDPIEEGGGLNLYGFVGNNGIRYYDILGLRPRDERVSSCVIKIFGGHGLLSANLPGEGGKITNPDTLKGVEIPVNITNDECSAATVISCNADRIVNIEKVIPNTPPSSGNVDAYPYNGPNNVKPEETFCGQIKGAIEAAKVHALTDLCQKGCCDIIKIEVWLMGKAKNDCPSTVGKGRNGYKGFVVNCKTGEITED